MQGNAAADILRRLAAQDLACCHPVWLSSTYTRGVFDLNKKRAAGVAVVHDPAGERRYLILRAFRNWDLPKGRLEPGETAWQAAVRETREETGLVDLSFHWGDQHLDTEPYAGGKVVRFFVAEVRERTVSLQANPQSGRAEHHEYRWVTLDEGLRLTAPRLQRVLHWADGLVTERIKATGAI